MNFQEWLGELAAGHTSHTKYIEWLTERIDDNRQLTREAAAEEQQRGRRLLAGLADWGKGLNRPTTSKVVMSKDNQVSTPERSVAEVAPAPAPAEKQQRDPTTSIEGPLLSGLVPPDSPLLSGTVSKFPQDFNEEGTESDRSDESLGTDAGVDPTHSSFGSEADNEVNYNGTSSDEERPSSENQPVLIENNQQPCAQPATTEQINQSIQQPCTRGKYKDNQPRRKIKPLQTNNQLALH